MSETGLKGACRCGTTRFEADGAPLLTMACHCRGCQRMTSGPFSLSSLFETKRFAVSGDVVRGGMKTGPNHRFCPECLSWLYTVPEGLEDYVNVRSSLFENASAHRPYIDVWTSEGLGWANSGAERAYETAPDDDEFGELMAAYAAWDGRVKQ